MEQILKENRYQIAPLFEGCNETMVWSCLQGCMGSAWADHADAPTSALIINADFCFLGGEPNVGLVQGLPSGFLILVPPSAKWAELIEQEYPETAKRITRYAIKKEPDVFNHQILQSNLKRLPAGYSLNRVDEPIYHQLNQENWSRDLCGQFPTYQDYQVHGIGSVVLYGDVPVSGASSYTYYNGGIEIQVDTKEGFRRKGLALACCSKLILTCLDQGLYPSWDAHNRKSVALSQKLGYHFDREYTAYELNKD